MPTVLVIEDDKDMQALESLALVCGGYDVRVASNGAEGLERLSQLRPCVIVLDLMMPVMDGLTFLRERNRTHVCDDVPVVCVTAGGRELMAEAMRLGAAQCVEKPADLDDLCRIVAGYCA